MKRFISIILTIFILLTSTTIFASEEKMNLSDFFGTPKESVTSISLSLVDGINMLTLTDQQVIEKFFLLCDNINLIKQEKNETQTGINGLYIDISTLENPLASFAYISKDGFVDKYNRLMSRLPLNAYTIDNSDINEIIEDFLKLSSNEGVKFSQWAKDYITESQNMKLSDFDDYTLPITRLEFCEMLLKMLDFSKVPIELPTEVKNIFSDCNSIAVEYFNKIGVINGKNENEFSPTEKITREEVATIIYRLSKKLNFEKFLDDYKLSSYKFFDTDKMSDWAIEAINQLKYVGLMDGIGNDLFAPKELFTREQGVVIVKKLSSEILTRVEDAMPKARKLQVFIQESKDTDKIVDDVNAKFSDKINIDKIPTSLIIDKTSLIIAAGEPCIILGKYDADFLKKLKEKNIKFDTFENNITIIYSNIGISELATLSLIKDFVFENK